MGGGLLPILHYAGRLQLKRYLSKGVAIGTENVGISLFRIYRAERGGKLSFRHLKESYEIS